jgi:hypothetical protein
VLGPEGGRADSGALSGFCYQFAKGGRKCVDT